MILTSLMPRIAGLLALLSLALCCVDVALSEEVDVQTGQTFRDCSECPEMVVIPAGSFLMGTSAAESARDLEYVVPKEEIKFAQADMTLEVPQHEVSFSQAFALGKYPVTRSEFAAFVHETGYSAGNGCRIWINHTYSVRPEAGWQSPGFSQTDRDPVVCVNRQDIQAYLAWLNGKLRGHAPAEGDGRYGLPSEAEWEYAARAGTRTARWWGDPIGSDNANCDGCGNRWDKKQTAPAGSFRANAFGLSDALGNVWESTEDCWNETYVGAPVDGRSWTAGICESRTMRAGSWMNHPWVLRSAQRSRARLTERTNYIGFRVAKTLPRTQP
jgi:formylglycine-generating enzyme required for sulfatase activity